MSNDSALLRALDQLERQTKPTTRLWRAQARASQLPPDGDWRIHLIMAGRGWGKTWTGANWIAEQAMKHAGTEWAVVAPTFRDVRKTCIEGPSGVIAAFEKNEISQYRRNELQITLENGSIIYGYSADQPERLRGANLSGAWCDELCAWRYPDAWYAGLVPAVRIGTDSRIIVTTTPRPTALVRDLVGRTDGSVRITRGSTWENADNLSPAALEELRRRYEGTRLGRQELEGELLENIEGALWTIDNIDSTRVRHDEVPDLLRVVVAVDPAVTSGEDADETGIVVVGEGPGGHGYVLADYTMRGTPDACMRKAVEAYKRHHADRIVGEVNNGGDYIGAVLRAVDENVPYSSVRASRGKAVRAEPVSALYEQRRMHHVGILTELENQMLTWIPDLDVKSPDRVDALVWACTELRGLTAGSWSDAYGALTCANCERMFLSTVSGVERKTCPFCQAVIEQAA